MDIRTREAVRYLGYGHHAIDELTLELIQDSFRELDQFSSRRFIYRIFEISIDKPNRIYLDNILIESKSLSKNLDGCSKAAVFAATLGVEVDRMLKRYAVSNVAKAVVMQACAAAKLEEYCDEIVEEIRGTLQEEIYLRPRFSPGYGDLSLEYQKVVLGLLDTPKKIGLTMTEASMLVPTKSVTAILGISNIDTKCHKEGCEICNKLDCAFRRS
jgi:hypothetical protein